MNGNGNGKQDFKPFFALRIEILARHLYSGETVPLRDRLTQLRWATSSTGRGSYSLLCGELCIVLSAIPGIGHPLLT